MKAEEYSEEVRLTDSPSGHMLSNSRVWTADSSRLIYDLRGTDEKFSSPRIESVDVKTGAIETVFEPSRGEKVGAAFVSDAGDEVALIIGPKPNEWEYGPTRRRGVIAKNGVAKNIDAENYAPPFFYGALRGGTHAHTFSEDGAMLVSTYEDEWLRMKAEKGEEAEANRRTVVLHIPHKTEVSRAHPMNADGEYFSFPLCDTVDMRKARKGSDDIVRACEEAWVGKDGYVKPDGTRQKKAVAFQGTVVASDGTTHAEVFIADIPDSFDISALEKIRVEEEKYIPAPKEITVRRLTFTESEKFRGVGGARHWLQSSPDGGMIGFLRLDENGVAQFCTVSPNGGEISVRTRSPLGVSSAFTWGGDGKFVAFVMDNSVFTLDIATGELKRITERSDDEYAPLPFACAVSPDSSLVAYMKRVPNRAREHHQIFVARLVKKAAQ